MRSVFGGRIKAKSANSQGKSVMTVEATKAAERPPTMLIVVSASDKPNRLAGVFSGDEAQKAQKLAHDAGHHAIEAIEPKLRELAGRLAPGKIANNTLTLSAIANAMKVDVEKALAEHKKLATSSDAGAPTPKKDDVQEAKATAAPDAANATSSAAASTSKPVASNRDGSTPSFVKEAFWNELAVGDLVLSIDFDSSGKPDGWYEAIITKIEGNKYTLRWRDYPEEGLRTRTREQFAFMHPRA